MEYGKISQLRRQNSEDTESTVSRHCQCSKSECKIVRMVSYCHGSNAGMCFLSPNLINTLKEVIALALAANEVG